MAVTPGVIAQPVLAQSDSGWSNQGLIYLLALRWTGRQALAPSTPMSI